MIEAVLENRGIIRIDSLENLEQKNKIKNPSFKGGVLYIVCFKKLKIGQNRVLSFNQMTFEYLKFRLMSVHYLHQLSIQSDTNCRTTITF